MALREEVESLLRYEPDSAQSSKARQPHSRAASACNHPYAVTRDGQRFLVPVTLNPAGPAPLAVILNWPAMLRR